MKIEGTIYCDGPNCERSAHVNVHDMAASRLPGNGWLRVVEYGPEEHVLAFCGYDCAMKHFASFPSEEVISVEGDE